jgi:hypothetical protein
MERIHTNKTTNLKTDLLKFKKGKTFFFNFLFEDLFKPFICLLLEKSGVAQFGGGSCLINNDVYL